MKPVTWLVLAFLVYSFFAVNTVFASGHKQFVTAYRIDHLSEETAFNINLGFDKLRLLEDGLRLEAGETFDYLIRIGLIDEEDSSQSKDGRGFKRSNGILGGGLCLISSALLETAAQAGLEIIEWRHHGSLIIPTYHFHRGLDATIWQAREDINVPVENDINLVFRNNTDFPYHLKASFSGGCVVVTAITSQENPRRGNVEVRKINDLRYETTLISLDGDNKLNRLTKVWQYKKIIELAR